MDFYALEPSGGYFGTKWAYAEEVNPVYLGNADTCPICGSAVSLKPWLPPFRAKLSSAKPEKWGDLLWIGGTSLAVSRRFKELYTAEAMTGIENFLGPIEFTRLGRYKSENIPEKHPEYEVIQMPWGAANQDDLASTVVYEHPENIKCSYCRVGVSGRWQEKVILEEGSWNGSDIFRPRGAPVVYMVSQRFKEFVDKHKITNAWLIPSVNYGFDHKRQGLFYVHE